MAAGAPGEAVCFGALVTTNKGALEHAPHGVVGIAYLQAVGVCDVRDAPCCVVAQASGVPQGVFDRGEVALGIVAVGGGGATRIGFCGE